ncbi:hypothetical protein MMYC01_207953 [Madurella mycetomatis]|uniref:Xylanolytic transcriptional activator regulatory domain-containing protein n=1 Tax=Madurella mycetomatis TaxID=100816 RepID=A0A175VT48_9PEZI|nr:hypothetical protein MMYC01_207953 [Madurella mycetomatis]
MQCVSTGTTCTYKTHNEPPSQHQQQIPVPTSQPHSASGTASLSNPPTTTHTHPTAGAGASTPCPAAAPSYAAGNPNSNRNSEPDFRIILHRLERLEGLSSASSIRTSENKSDGTGISSVDGTTRQPGIQDGHRIALNKTRTLRWNHLLGHAAEFEAIGNCYMEAVGMAETGTFQDPETRALVAEMGELLLKCKMIARLLKVGRPGRGFTPLAVRLGDSLLPAPSKGIADAMMALYFGAFESTHRILHAPTFLGEYARFWDRSADVAMEVRLKVLLVVAIGSSMSREGDATRLEQGLVEQWIYTAQMWLSGPLEKDRLSIGGLQIHCLLIIARQIFSVGGDLAWTSMGLLVHHAMQMGFHRDPTHLPPMSALQVESSLDTAMPPRVSLDEFDTLPPSNVNDDDLLEGMSMADLVAHPRTAYTSTSLQLLLMDSFAVRLRTLNLLNRLNSEIVYKEVLGLSSEITNACSSANAFALRHSELVTPFHRNMLDYLVRRFLIPLHCPFAIQARTANPLYHYSLKVTLETALAIISPEPELEAGAESGGFTRLLVIGGGLFKEGVRLALTAISMELLAQTTVQQREGTLRIHAGQRNELKHAIRQMMRISEERLNRGETNIKAYMFLRMVLAQAEAIEIGAEQGEIERAIALAARNALLFCVKLLEHKAASVSLGESALPGSDVAYDMDVDGNGWEAGG